LKIRHTAASQIGQIYVGPVNWMLMVCTIALVAGFKSSSHLAAAYGVAVTSTMLITTTLFFVVSRRKWQWPLPWAAALTALFFLVDIPFFLANITKILHGAWFPLAIGAIFFTLMLTWNKGRRVLASELQKIMPPVHRFIVDLVSHPPNKITGDAVFLTSSPHIVPMALLKNVRHNKVLHSRTVLLTFRVEDVPRVPNIEKVRTEKLDGGFHRISVHYGFMEEPRLDTVFSLAKEKGLDLNPETTDFFIGRENLYLDGTSGMSRWRAGLFIFMSRNAADATSFFNLPTDRVIEVGVRLAI
jgi:KUP system potassium uptake protein